MRAIVWRSSGVCDCVCVVKFAISYSDAHKFAHAQLSDSLSIGDRVSVRARGAMQRARNAKGRILRQLSNNYMVTCTSILSASRSPSRAVPVPLPANLGVFTLLYHTAARAVFPSAARMVNDWRENKLNA